MDTTHYDIIIAGAGLSGLSLAYRAFKTEIWDDKKVLLIDASFDKNNDKTWSFWETKKGPFEDVVHKQWNQFSFYSNNGEQIPIDAGNYTYKSIQSKDFYDKTLSYLRKVKQLTLLETSISAIKNDGEIVIVETPSGSYSGMYVFNSLYQKPKLKTYHNYFLQHFKGYVIETDQFKGDINTFQFMDYRTPQVDGAVFVYVLPFSKTKILVEYTLFSKELLEEKAYDKAIETYIKEVLHINHYTVIETEKGIIPMTDYHFNRFDGNIVNIGSAGGDTRGSTGYTFQNVQKTVGHIISSFKENQHPFFKEKTINKKHQLYDKTLLNVLDKDQYKGHQIFTDLFKKTPADTVLKFLDGETSLAEDIKIMSSLNVMPFAKAFIKAIFK